MQPRFFTLFGFLALFAVVVSIHANDETVERANPAAKVVAKIIGSIFAGAAASCLGEAAAHCKQHWKHAHAAMQCGKDFLHNNRGRCASG